MDNKTIAKKFKLCSQLMELHNENPFRTKAIASASFKLDKIPFLLETASLEEISSQPGIGKSTAEKVKKLAETGSFDELDAMLSITPEGILEMLNIKGLGPKKIQIIWTELQIESVGELLYACNENRLIEAKGFGLKTQEDIKKSIEFSISNQGWFLYARVLSNANNLLASLQKNLSPTLISFTGDFRRKCEVLSAVDILLDTDKQTTLAYLNTNYADSLKEELEYISFRDELGFSFHIYLSATAEFYQNLILTTGSKKHLELLDLTLVTALGSEEEIYAKQGLDYIEPELREGLDEVFLAKNHQLPKLINFDDLKGTLHNHSTYSDGVHTLAEMARYTKEELGLSYFGICDHSKTAVYANGLPIERVQKQWEEIDQLNQQLAPFKIFKGIESDILSDGSLDYPDEILAGFDFVVASVHSNLKMDEEKATARLLKAIENPYTTILGHPTGRLLLSRSGYPLDYKKIIDACAANNVVIEINANPLRLDLDWRWHRYALEKGVLLSINPDAHRTEGLLDMHYGIFVARKGGLSAKNCLNSFSLTEIESFFNKKS
ncbi:MULTISPECIES: DNA polymerase/3'-5' exonuclease PolX [unclassified Sphingobacterium]|uniref:DNA polymerase/3'-5' exonuclease PolX n=1 Tax=unclassified Sphingobacterium TaxID=2609468 RepID=UPI0010506C61|nr:MULTISPECIES: DNA polymerase/3'-5' exonuclease PolX [unclassified Sphingobacterium]MCS3556094.1 DNA polymerase (family 10) [Sphingobacterium sp. JUb21]TCR08470.1 DNA polymerase (family 10) [Sphingobacterium sp. JUb20]